jgi:hypothetical protein
MTLFLSLLGGCGGEPTRSYCEAVCDWAVDCQSTERTIDEAASLEACLTETRASDPSCAKAEEGSIDPVSKKALQGCVSAIDAAAGAGECTAFVGSIDEIKTGTAPAECLTQGGDVVATFEAARDATTETGPELCQRYTETYCRRTEECVLADFDGSLPQAAQDALGSPYDLCVARLEPVFTTQCTDDDLYLPETSLDDVNTARQGARECLAQFDTVSCEDLLAGQLPEFCAASFTSTDQATQVGGALFQLAQDYAQYL